MTMQLIVLIFAFLCRLSCQHDLPATKGSSPTTTVKSHPGLSASAAKAISRVVAPDKRAFARPVASAAKMALLSITQTGATTSGPAASPVKSEQIPEPSAGNTTAQQAPQAALTTFNSTLHKQSTTVPNKQSLASTQLPAVSANSTTLLLESTNSTPPTEVSTARQTASITTVAQRDNSTNSTLFASNSTTASPLLQTANASTQLYKISPTSSERSVNSSNVTTQASVIRPTQRPPFQGMQCGNTIPNIGGNRIVGGQEAVPHSWPWQVLITCAIRNTKTATLCGGNLLSGKWVLTAAHCLISTQFSLDVISDCVVKLGKHFYGGKQKDPAEVSARIGNYYVHPQYDFQRVIRGYDIALLRLAGSVKLNQRIKPICLPFGLPELRNDSVCFTAGWGFTNPKEKTQAEFLKQLKMNVQEVGYCQFTRVAVGPVICAGILDAWPDICLGDSGGPLSCRGSDGRWYLHGAASMVESNCRGVASFTKVAAFQDWITQTISSNPKK